MSNPDNHILSNRGSIQDPVSDFQIRATTVCITIPINLNWETFATFVKETATPKPTTFRLYIQDGFPDENLERVKEIILENYTMANIQGVFGLSQEQINRIVAFVDEIASYTKVSAEDIDKGRVERVMSKISPFSLN